MLEVVFLPNKAARPGGSRLKDLLGECRKGSTRSWTCKKMAKEGDLYLFYFGSPEFKIHAVGVVRGDVEERAGEFDWTNKRIGWFCGYRPLRQLHSPISKSEIASHPILRTWWRARPYRGGSKQIPPRQAGVLLRIIARRNPNLTGLFGASRAVHAAPRAGANRLPRPEGARRSPALVFKPEFTGMTSVRRAGGVAAILRRHGRVVGALRRELAARGFSRACNDRKRDLVLGLGRRCILFEIKTDCSTASIYAAVGQLMLHGAKEPRTPQCVAVLPGRPNAETKRGFHRLGIHILSYRWRAGVPAFDNMDDVLRR